MIDFKVGDQVRVITTTFKGWEGRIILINNKLKYPLLVRFDQRENSLFFKPEELEKIIK